MKLSDYVFDYLKSKGVDTVFYLPGGGCMHLLDTLGCYNKRNEINAVSLLHEQAVAIAAENYAATTGKPGCVLVTTGPGATNTITGCLAAHLDSSPVFYISGQCKTADLKSRYGVRSLGNQEADIAAIVSSITKYSVMVTDKTRIRYELEKAWFEMEDSRRGPVWVDIPLDIQGAQIEPDKLEGFNGQTACRKPDILKITDTLSKSKRPVIIAGNGLAKYREIFNILAEKLQMPIIPTWKAMDLISNDNPLYAGRAGGMGDRYGNLTMQNADLILSFASRLDFSITGYDRSEWAANATKIVIEADSAEIAKFDNLPGIEPIIADVGDVIKEILKQPEDLKLQDISSWKVQLEAWKNKYPITPPPELSGKLTTYAFVQELSKQLPEGAYITPCSSGTTAEIFFQAFNVKKGQTIRSNHGLGAMGFDIPAAIGMCIASGGKPVVCVTGDGGVQLNIQELAVIAGRDLPIKLFIINNNGYASVRNMQLMHFEGRFIGCDEDSGLYLPDFEKLSEAYKIPYRKVSALAGLEGSITSALSADGSYICDVYVDGNCMVTPRTATQVMKDGTMRTSRLENQYPFLPEDEVKENILH